MRKKWHVVTHFQTSLQNFCDSTGIKCGVSNAFMVLSEMIDVSSFPPIWRGCQVDNGNLNNARQIFEGNVLLHLCRIWEWLPLPNNGGLGSSVAVQLSALSLGPRGHDLWRDGAGYRDSYRCVLGAQVVGLVVIIVHVTSALILRLDGYRRQRFEHQPFSGQHSASGSRKVGNSCTFLQLKKKTH